MTASFTTSRSSTPAGALVRLTVRVLALLWLVPVTSAMTPARQLQLREEARNMFRHGWESYWDIAFPEDEVKPLTCVSHHRDRENPKDIGTNDALGEFSLTAIDSLSTMAVMASSSVVEAQRFWDATEELVRIYWYNLPKDGNSTASSAWGRFQGRSRSTRGFDIDAKVQVFETTIRGLGGLLSAHLFAKNALPGLPHRTDFRYNDELLHLADDLGRRLLPALTQSPTGIPYPRINLRHGLPHGVKNPRYYNRILGNPPFKHGTDPEHPSERFWRHPKTIKREKPDEETTETCTAGAGSLVLEFTTLSRLTGNPVFERAAKKAFDAIWKRRSPIGLVGAGVDAESGRWTGANSGIGAGVDSFFEYAFKSYVLLAGNPGESQMDDSYFLDVWEKSRTALERHVLVREPALWWNNVHVNTGAGIQGGAWIDSLGGFFAGTLSQAGSAAGSDGGEDDDALELAVQGNLVYSALWNRYNALPERFNTRLSTIEGGLSWYPGRPEFIESTYLLYRATKDPFWLHVGEMAMRDLKRRCWARCGWAGLQDVRTGERQNRMESFWLSETWKYLFLLFDEDNPLHKLDAPWVFTTEGHPIILPHRTSTNLTHSPPPRTCRRPPSPSSFFSATASRPDLFHAAYFTKLHLSQTPDSTITASDPSHLYHSPSNSTFYPYTLPPYLVPPNAMCAPLPTRDSLELLFPDGFQAPNMIAASTLLSRFTPKIQRVPNGIRILSLDALRLSLITDERQLRISKISGVQLGREERVFVDRNLVEGIRDVNFEVVRDEGEVDLLLSLSPVSGDGAGGVLQELLNALGLAEGEVPPAKIPAVIIGQGEVAELQNARVAVVAGCGGRVKGEAEVVVVKMGGDCAVAEKVAGVRGVRLVVVEDGGDVEGVESGVGIVVVGEGVRWERVVRVGVRRRVGVRVQGREVGGLEIT